MTEKGVEAAGWKEEELDLSLELVEEEEEEEEEEDVERNHEISPQPPVFQPRPRNPRQSC